MLIAIPVEGGKLCAHFGHCSEFALIDVDQGRKSVNGVKTVEPPPHEPGVLPKWLASQGVGIVIAGGMGRRAQDLFSQAGIDVIVGAPSESPEAVARDYLNGTLSVGGNVCDH